MAIRLSNGQNEAVSQLPTESKVTVESLKQSVLLSLVCCLLASPTFAAERPNIVLIMADDMGYECLSANGSLDYTTPCLDRMAARGLRFEHCYSQPICTPSRVKLMTGQSNKRNYVKFGMLDRSLTTFAQLLKKVNYATCIAGKWQLGKEADAPQHFGFDKALLWQHTRGRQDKQKHDTRYPNPRLELNSEKKNYTDGEFSSDLFLDFIKQFIVDHKEQTFLVYYPMALVHCPFCPTPDSEDWDPTSLGSKTYKGDPQYFADMVAYADKTVGSLVDFLKEQGLEENTLVMFVGDNGTDTPIVTNTVYGQVIGAKGSTVDGGNHVPCIMQWPARTKKNGRVLKDLVDFSDFLPSICEAAGVDIPNHTTYDGQSFLPLFAGDQPDRRKSIFQWYSRNGVPEKAREFARAQRYKLYSTGEFYDVSNDRLEKYALQDLSREQLAVRSELQAHLDRYKDVIPPQGR